VDDRDLWHRRLELDDLRRLALLDVGLLARGLAEIGALGDRLEDLLLGLGLGGARLQRRDGDRVITIRHHDGIDLLLALGIEAGVVVGRVFVRVVGHSRRGDGRRGLARALGMRRRAQSLCMHLRTSALRRLGSERIHLGREVRKKDEKSARDVQRQIGAISHPVDRP
jgi:hypothetical protein